MLANTIKQHSTNLFFQEGNSDKVYHAAVHKVPNGYNVFFSYGRRGGNMTEGYKSEVPYPRIEDAIKVYEKLIDSKVKKGYQHS
jgi:bifunctional non-homologous end joining protein LigD